jgi:hypothetical protein
LSSDGGDGGGAAVIRVKDDIITFVQVWEVADTEAQDELLAIMYESIRVLAVKRGFVSMTPSFEP